jgi:hypothetical protein
MKQGSVVAPLVLIGIGVLFLLNNLNPELSVLGLLSQFWPFLLIGWGVLRLIEIGVWAMRGKPLPVAGVSGGEWVLIVFVSLIGSSLFFVNERVTWPPGHFRMKGIEVFGRAYDFPMDEKAATTGKTPRIIIENSYGNARVIAGDVDEVKVTGRKTVRAYNQEDARRSAERVHLQLNQTGDIVTVSAVQESRRDDQFVTTDLEITVPRGAYIQGRGRRGDFDVTGTSGNVEIDSDNAGVRIQSVTGDVRVELRASDIVRATDVTGNVDLKGYGHDVELENISGQVTVAGNYFGELQFRRIAKPVRFEGGIKSRTSEFSAAACPGEIRMERGRLIMENVTGPVVITAKSKDIELSDVTQSVQVRLDGGDVELRPTQNPVPAIDVTTASGNIELVLPENAKFALKAVSEKGEVENEFGEVLTLTEHGRGATLTGTTGQGPQVSLRSDRGAVRVRKGSSADFAPAPPRPPRVPLPPGAAKDLVVERN